MTNNPKIALIAAAASNRTIGKDGDLPWHLPDDLKFFMEKTTHHPVVMGRKSYEALPAKYRPLPNRTNIIITRQDDYQAPGAVVFHDLKSALDYARIIEAEEVFITGGGQVYAQALDIADRIYLTEVDAEVEGDAHFPQFDAVKWIETERRHHPADERHKFAFDFVVYEKKA
jgi:dihydrofolate reductase